MTRMRVGQKVNNTQSSSPNRSTVYPSGAMTLARKVRVRIAGKFYRGTDLLRRPSATIFRSSASDPFHTLEAVGSGGRNLSAGSVI